jgi:hypothetical protein
MVAVARRTSTIDAPLPTRYSNDLLALGRMLRPRRTASPAESPGGPGGGAGAA